MLRKRGLKWYDQGRPAWKLSAGLATGPDNEPMLSATDPQITSRSLILFFLALRSMEK